LLSPLVGRHARSERTDLNRVIGSAIATQSQKRDERNQDTDDPLFSCSSRDEIFIERHSHAGGNPDLYDLDSDTMSLRHVSSTVILSAREGSAFFALPDGSCRRGCIFGRLMERAYNVFSAMLQDR
jgi:hypothetical protein